MVDAEVPLNVATVCWVRTESVDSAAKARRPARQHEAAGGDECGLSAYGPGLHPAACMQQ